MSRLLVAFVLGVGIFSCCAVEGATATATITYSIPAIDVIAISGGSPTPSNPAAFTVVAPAAGSQPATVTDSSTTMSVTTNSAVNRTLSAQLASSMPSGVTFTVNVAAGSSGGTSNGAVDVADGASHNLVTQIKQAVASNMTIGYAFTATVATPVTGSTNVILTYTLQ